MGILLVAIDLNEGSDLVVKKAISMLKENQTIFLVHVVQVDTIYAGLHQIDVDVFSKKANDLLNEYASSTKKVVSNVLSQVVYSSSVSSGILVDICDNYHIDLLVCGHRINHELFHRSRCLNIVKNINCDVYVVKV